MRDLLSRQDVIDAFWKLNIELRPSAIDAITDMLKTLPSAESEIIRCKDCKQFRRWIDTDICFCDITEAEMSDNDFCSKSERRTDDGE